MRPRSINEFVGQEHFFGEGKLLRRMLAADRLSSLMFYGPSGTGKTALAQVIANHTQSKFRPLNATSTGIKEVREVLTEARANLETSGERTILFLDEMHRFNKAQQDVLLPDVEEGIVTLIGATTQNPFFAINSPLLSRSQIFTFEPLSKEHIKTIIRRALSDKERGLGDIPIHMHDDALEFLAEISDGDARRALMALEIGVRSTIHPPPCPPPEAGGGKNLPHPAGGAENLHLPPPRGEGRVGGSSASAIDFTLALAQDSIQRKLIDFDPTGDAHYDLASALIKSMRGSDPDAAIYWLARMLEAGEDPRFIARRIVILASEDIGNADPQALLVATAAWHAVEMVGLPECQLTLSQAVAYMATAPKSNAATVAIGKARKDVREGRTLPVPKHLRDSHYRGAESFGHGEGYQYSHDFDEAIADQVYLPEERRYYEPTDRGFEAEIRRRLEEWRKTRRAERRKPPGEGEGGKKA